MATLLKSWLKAKPNATRRQGKIAYTPRIPTDATEHRPFFMPSSPLLLFFPSLVPSFLSSFALPLHHCLLLGPLSLAIWYLLLFYPWLLFMPKQHLIPNTPGKTRGYMCALPCMCVCVCVCKWLSACKTAHSAGQLNSSTNWIFMILFFMALSLLTELTQGGEGPQEYEAYAVVYYTLRSTSYL